MRKKKMGTENFPNHMEELGRLRKVNGQLAGIEKMILSQRYCPEIIQQIRAATSALKALELAVIRAHISSCIKKSVKSDSPKEFEAKIKELMELIKG